MDPFSPSFVQQVRHQAVPKDLFHRMVIQEVAKTLGTDFDEHDRAAEINIVTDFYLNAYEFAVSQMCFDDVKTGEVLKVVHVMVNYDVFIPADQKQANSEPTDTIHAAETAFQKMRDQLMSEVGLFSVEEIKAVSEYFFQAYISNIRLYSHALSSKQQSETTVVTIFVDDPLPTLPLGKAVERIKLPKEDMSEKSSSSMQKKVSKLTKVSQVFTKKKDETLEGEKSPLIQEDQSDSLDKKIENFSEKLTQELERRDQILEKTVEDHLKGKKK